MTIPSNFQSMIMSLNKYWADNGCLIWQPYHTEVGAGTMNPGTVLRVLGPEPWNVAYIEPSIRPDDGRYGKNPNRFYQHIQYQVILKPDPGNPQELYLNSLLAIGIDPQRHDIRFVEDNWESPALGAWGLGWEVWMDGLEITQFTYFQQSGGQSLDPVSVELTYGLERISMALQNVRDFRQLRWNETMTYGDVYYQNEQEFSKYSFEIADIDHLKQLFDIYESEAQRCLDELLVLPAHDNVLKCSHTFNVLDTRGAIGVTERQGFFRRMRSLSRRVSEAYIDQRKNLEFPWLPDEKDLGMALSGEIGALDTLGSENEISGSHPFILEIGVEELPSADIETAIIQLNNLFSRFLDQQRLGYLDLKVYATPRRLVIHIDQLTSRQEDLDQIVKGPPKSRSFDDSGNLTPAALGFARSKGISVDALETREISGGEYIVASVRQAGRMVVEILSEKLPEIISKLNFPRTMRWNSTNVSFSRPIRWLMAMYAEYVIPFSYAGLSSGSVTYGIRFQDPGKKDLSSVQEYFSFIESQGIILDQIRRKEAIVSRVQQLAEQVGGSIREDSELLIEVTNLIEAPNPMLGKYNPQHLELPRDVLISVMKKHQRYFPVEKDGNLLPYFITVANKPKNGEFNRIVRGNEDVIRARFTDAAYFVDQDKLISLQEFLPKLKSLTFQESLGSMWDKTQRIIKLVEMFTLALSLDLETAKNALRTAELAKADLATQMVVDMTSLQGVIGKEYALSSGENPEVAKAIYEHYLPRFSGDKLPETYPGLIVGLADRIDTLIGLFSAGMAPTGAKDPFAQRRAALGIVTNLIAWELDFDLVQAIETASVALPIDVSRSSKISCFKFIAERLKNHLLEQGKRHDVVDAVIARHAHNPSRAVVNIDKLSIWIDKDDWRSILPAFARCVRITRDLQSSYDLNINAFVEEAEINLYKAYRQANDNPRDLESADDFLNAFVPMIPAVNTFFDDVLVMVEDDDLRKNRLSLLQAIVELAAEVADFSKLEGF